ncbi:MAG: type I-D CRISPR-associated protein Cas7/Csc2 [Candidatus Aenigmarchaeota archaeon]|nr:type I-D CRISPR-associated protein Cas7/Csc2 [Candidatus Aenigmarchaeota archaeon]
MTEIKTSDLLEETTILSKGRYLQLVIKLKFLDDAIIRSNDNEEVLTYKYKELGNRFIIPWRKVKAKLRRLVMEKQRGFNIESNCHLKDNLCMRCPSCFIFGGTGETSNTKAHYNILARILGETFISIEETKEIEPYTANAVDEKNLTTGQALMNIIKVPAETEFLGVITIRDPTPEIVSIVVDNINRLSRLGARTVEWGKVRTEILGCNLSDREDLNTIDLVSKGLDKIKGELNTLDSKLPKVDKAYKDLDNKFKKELKKEKLI